VALRLGNASCPGPGRRQESGCARPR
jgi:hypothetical protein